MPIMIFMTRFYHSFLSQLRLKAAHNINILLLALMAGIFFLINSCEENPTTIGNELLPGSDFVNVKSTDTISVNSYTMYRDSVSSGNPQVSYLGQVWDPYFGTTTAELVTQMRLGSVWDDKYFVIDSVRLYLKLLSVQGDVSKPHYLRLSETSEQIYVDSAYYSNRNVPLTGYSVPDILLPTLKADTVNDIVLDLPVQFGDFLTRDTSMLYHDTTSIQSDFRSYFKGLYFQIISPDDPIFVSLSVKSPGLYDIYANYITLFMHDESMTSKSFSFIFDAVSQNAAYNRYVHDYSTADPLKKIQHISDGYLDTVTFVQTMNGVYTKLKIPGLEGLRTDTSFKNILINKARIILPVFYDGDLYKPSTLPTFLYLSYNTTSGTQYFVPDMLVTQFYDGTPDTTANVYKINIVGYLQQYLHDTQNEIKPELDLFMDPLSSNNVILKTNRSHSPIKFEFTYTKF
jgi:hypothetical protein